MIDLLRTALWMSTPIGYAALGESIAETSGMLNVGLEGMMLFAGFVGVAVARVTGDATLGLLAGALAGAAVGALHAFLVLWVRLDQAVSGIALNLLALGTSSVLFATLFEGSSGGSVTGLPEVHVPLLEDLPLLGPVLFQQRAVTIVLPIVAAGVALVLARSRTGLRMRAAGHDAGAAMLEGVSVRRTRLWSNVSAGLLAGIGGAFLTLGIANQFSDEIIAGRGFIALAVVIIGRWNPLLVVLVAWFFGFAQAYGIRLQTSGTSIPFQLFLAIPYLLTLVVLFGRLGRGEGPREVGQAWSTESL